MAFQPVVDTAAIDIIYTQHGETLQNVFYARLPGGYLLADLVALAAQIDSLIPANWFPEQAVEAVYQRTEVRGLAVQNDLLATDNTSTGPGTNPSGALPNSVTVAIKKESGLTGRSARGRCYWIGVPLGKLLASDENKLAAAYVALVTAAVDAVRTNIPLVGVWEPVLVSRFTNGAARTPAGITFPWISSVAVNDQVDNQRGRMP